MKKVWLLSLAVALAGILVSYTGSGDAVLGASDRAFQPFEFPFANPAVIVRMAAWGIPNWSGTQPHNGMDFQVDGRLASTRIISPAAGEVTSVSSSENPFSNPPGQLMVTISIRVNSEWTVDLVLEPSTIDPVIKVAQLAAVLVQPGQEVSTGDPVADLLVGTLGYPHLHYMAERDNANVCAYAYSSETAKRVIEAIARLPNSTVPGGQICFGKTPLGALWLLLFPGN